MDFKPIMRVDGAGTSYNVTRDGRILHVDGSDAGFKVQNNGTILRNDGSNAGFRINQSGHIINSSGSFTGFKVNQPLEILKEPYRKTLLNDKELNKSSKDNKLFYNILSPKKLFNNNYLPNKIEINEINTEINKSTKYHKDNKNDNKYLPSVEYQSSKLKINIPQTITPDKLNNPPQLEINLTKKKSFNIDYNIINKNKDEINFESFNYKPPKIEINLYKRKPPEINYIPPEIEPKETFFNSSKIKKSNLNDLFQQKKDIPLYDINNKSHKCRKCGLYVCSCLDY